MGEAAEDVRDVTTDNKKRLFVWFYVGFTVGVAWYPKHREIIFSLPFVTIQYEWGPHTVQELKK